MLYSCTRALYIKSVNLHRTHQRMIPGVTSKTDILARRLFDSIILPLYCLHYISLPLMVTICVILQFDISESLFS
ncbi:uncharacterized protein Dyak_GE27869, isoform A [Drosophila yakuba]|uniref:Uncharacterized protein, isoform A n=1 Tax=Drosophila yakuba TaxID=7245 RepID=A0A0R1E0Y5_DROYA|nr:uncharacterized protein Dyak_GE27869, isoform A [Drosophila yakuba]